MTGMNKVILIGNLGSNPEIRVTQSQQKVATLSLATTETYQSNGERREDTQWHRVILWNGLAEIAEKYLVKGRQIALEGRLKHRQWEDDQAITRYITEIHADKLILLGPPPK